MIPTLLSSPSISCFYSRDSVDQLLRSNQTLAVVRFSSLQDIARDAKSATPANFLSIPLPLLEDNDLKEVWRSTLAVSTGCNDGFAWAQTDDVLFVSYKIMGAEFSDVNRATQHAYNGLLRFISDAGYPHIIRVWNYIPGINVGAGNEERYKQFCYGRHQAFVNHNYPLGQFPSACALGQQDGSTTIYLIAAKQAGTHFENPQQVSAYHYPREYGPKSPSFARATLAGNQIYLSGTASIIGHESQYPDDLCKQIEVTLNNIDTLLQHIAQQIDKPPPTMQLIKIYLRHPQYLAETRARVQAHFGDIPMMFLQADICREELLIEIEGLCTLQ